MAPPRCRTGVLPGREDSEFTSDPSVLPTTSIVSSPFMTSPVLLRDTTLSKRDLETAFRMSDDKLEVVFFSVLGAFRHIVTSEWAKDRGDWARLLLEGV